MCVRVCVYMVRTFLDLLSLLRCLPTGRLSHVIHNRHLSEHKLNRLCCSDGKLTNLDTRPKEHQSILTELCESKGCVVSDGRHFVLKEKGAESISCQASPHIYHKVWALLNPPPSSQNSFQHKVKSRISPPRQCG